MFRISNRILMRWILPLLVSSALVPRADGKANDVAGATIENMGPGFVVVTHVDPSSAAGSAGMLPGDVIVAVNNIAVHSVTELKDTIWRTGLTPVIFSVTRNGVGYVFTFPVQ
jgi:S1-C subfamily serine protease